MNESNPTLLPLTTAQRGLWVGHKIGGEDAVMNIAEAIEICGPVVPELFQRALWQITREAETTRVSISEHEGLPRQTIRAEYNGDFPYIDFSQEADPYAAADRWMMAEIKKPVEGSVVMAVDGDMANPSHYAVNSATGVVTFLPGHIPAINAAITAGFEFDVPVRFDTDRLELNLSQIEAGDIPSIPVVEIRI